MDDEPDMARTLSRTLQDAGYTRIETAGSVDAALEALRSQAFDLVLTDHCMPERTGLDLLDEIRRLCPGTDVVFMTAYADVATARRALKRGAEDFLSKPFDQAELLGLLETLAARRALARQDDREVDRTTEFFGLVTVSENMRETFERVRKAAETEATVLVLGESGTGKQLIAQAIHRLSPRRDGPFVQLDCGAIPETLIENELFGHERGAYSGADAQRDGLLSQAHGGTLFLDEVGELPPTLQPKLLRFLQERKFYRVGGTDPVAVDVRVIAATNRDLEQAVKEGRFREDLYYRLEVFKLHVPPLRERPEDIEVLAHRFLEQRSGPGARMSDRALAALRAFDWPGNVRELENTIARAAIECGGKVVEPAHLGTRIRRGKSEVSPPSQPDRETASAADAATPLDLEENERRLVLKAIEDAGGNKTRAAELLGISRRRLYSRLKVLGIGTDESDGA